MDNNTACGTLVAVEEVLHNAAFANLGRKEKAQKMPFRHLSHMPTNIFKYHLNKSFTMQTIRKKKTLLHIHISCICGSYKSFAQHCINADTTIIPTTLNH